MMIRPFVGKGNELVKGLWDCIRFKINDLLGDLNGSEHKILP